MTNNEKKLVADSEYYKSLSLSWANLAIALFHNCGDDDDDDRYFNLLISHGNVIYHEFREDFEKLWLLYFPDLSSIPFEITENYICDECGKENSEPSDYDFF